MRSIGRLLFVVAGLAGCSTPPSTTQTAAAPSSAVASPSGAGGPAEVRGRAPAGALVMLEPTDTAAPLPAGNAVMDQFSKAFVPETLFVRVGQPVTFKNSEDQLHNVTVIRSRTGRGVFNISQSQGDVHNHTFDQQGEYDVSCDVHPGMKAVIVATTTPYAAYVDANGAFAFSNVAPGQYRLKISAGGRDSDRVVTVSGPRVELEP